VHTETCESTSGQMKDGCFSMDSTGGSPEEECPTSVYFRLRNRRGCGNCTHRLPPEEIRVLFRAIEKLPVSEEQVHGIQDVCMGYCYDPVAALGFSILQQRTRLLRRSASGAGWR
jgi:hypothetical protein